LCDDDDVYADVGVYGDVDYEHDDDYGCDADADDGYGGCYGYAAYDGEYDGRLTMNNRAVADDADICYADGDYFAVMCDCDGVMV